MSARSGCLGRRAVQAVTAFRCGVFASAGSVVGPAGLVGAVLAVPTFGGGGFAFAGRVVGGPAGMEAILTGLRQELARIVRPG